MSKNDEIEAKILLPKSTYQKMCRDFVVKSSFNQENYYFDTDNALLKQEKISCRIRLFNNHAEQTLKVPNKNQVQQKFHEAIEINDNLSLSQARSLIEKGQQNIYFSFQGNVGQFLQDYFGNNINLKFQTYSKTHRILANGPKNCELTFDKTSYPDQSEDFELEIENSNPNLIKEVLAVLKEKYGFRQNSLTTNQAKIARAFSHRGKI